MLIAICLALVVLVALLAIPSDMWSLIGENCLDHRGRVRARYVWRETKAAGHFFAGSLLGAFVLSILVFGALLVVDEKLIRLSLVKRAVGQFQPDVQQWKHELSHDRSSVRREHERRILLEGGSKEDARESSRFLWNAIPLAVVLGFALIVTVIRLTSRGYSMAMDQWVVEATARNRRKVARHYLLHTAQQDDRWQRRPNRNDED